MDKPLLLIVEDEPISREVLIDALHEGGYATLQAETGADAWQLILQNRHRLDAILLDRLLPDMDALSLLVRMKADVGLTHLPVVMQTSLSSESDIADGLKAGAYYYLTKPFPPTMLLAIVRSAVEDHHRYRALQASLRQSQGVFHHLKQAEFWFTTQYHARDLATQVAHAAPDPERIVLGLTELMLNAIEHGNLNIGYAEKTRLIAAGCMEDEVERRLQRSPYAERRATLTINRDSKQVRFTVRDEGNGFDWQPFLDLTPARAFDTHGRGIAMSRLISFDLLEYHDGGRAVTGAVYL